MSEPHIPEGWKLVPIEPTLEMWDQAENEMIYAEARLDSGDRQDAFEFPTRRIWQAVVAYRAMVKNAPDPTTYTPPQPQPCDAPDLF